MTVKDVYNYIDSFAPFSSAEDWDNSGLLVGDEDSEITSAVVCLDVTADVISFSKEIGAQLIISHHPVIFTPKADFLKGTLAFEACRAGISIISAHTNLDKAPGGVNDALCDKLGFPYEKASADFANGFLNICTSEAPLSASQLSQIISEKLNTSVSFSDGGELISRFAVCSGSGSDFIEDALSLSCEALLTGEASYHKYLDARDASLSLLSAGHFETEYPVVTALTNMLNMHFGASTFIAYPSVNTINKVNY